ncbi:MAG: YXWGXW repeat-containing protein [Terriglobales bacterium]
MNIRPRIRSLWIVAIVMAFITLTHPMALSAQVEVSITVAPPAIPVYDQPLCPGDGYIWTPGYWAYDYDDSDYYWVPGTWVEAPEAGFLWTPGWWGWSGAAFVFHDGYWGPHVGFYGGIDYGFGYFGVGFEGGRWENGRFFYNRSVNNVNVTVVHNVYNTTVVHETTVNRVSYNGGNGGITARPRPEDQVAEHDRHLSPVAAQKQHVELARSNQQLRASVNHGKPEIAATARPTEFRGGGAVPAKEAGAPYHPPAGRGENARGEKPQPRPTNNNVPRPAQENNTTKPEERNNVPRPNAVHPNDLPAREPSSPPSTANTKLDKRYQQQQEKLNAQQDKERQKLQQKQDAEHQKNAKQMADEKQKQQIEQRHQQQTQKLEQKQAQQQRKLQEKQQPGSPKQHPQ